MKSLIIVDIQPFYHRYHKHITPELLKYIQERGEHYENILWFFNAKEVGIEESVVDMLEYIGDYDILSEEEVDNIVFIDKYYAFFRNWMDEGVDIEFIKYVIKYMIKHDINSSDDIDDDALDMLISNYYGLNADDFKEHYSSKYNAIVGDTIHIPGFKWEVIKDLGSVDICGGGRTSCLLEMKILLESVGVGVNELNKFIYAG